MHMLSTKGKTFKMASVFTQLENTSVQMLWHYDMTALSTVSKNDMKSETFYVSSSQFSTYNVNYYVTPDETVQKSWFSDTDLYYILISVISKLHINIIWINCYIVHYEIMIDDLKYDCGYFENKTALINVPVWIHVWLHEEKSYSDSSWFGDAYNTYFVYYIWTMFPMFKSHAFHWRNIHPVIGYHAEMYWYHEVGLLWTSLS